MSHATLAFSQVPLWAVEVTDGHGRTRYLEEPAARADFEQTPDWSRYAEKVEAQRSRRQEFEESAEVERDVVVRRDTGGLLKSRVTVDFVRFGKDRHEVKAGSGAAFVRRHALEVYPELTESPDPFERWYAAHRREYHTWRAALITAAGTEPVALDLEPQPLASDARFPTQAAMRELDRLEAEGWRLLHTSEDHALTAQVVRVRYLLTRS